MTRLSLAVLALSALGLGACAGMPPGADAMSTVPVVRYGSPAPQDGDFVLHYPAGMALPVEASVTGTLLERTGHATLDVTLKRDIYLYRQWVSFDGRTWQAADGVVTAEFRMTLPGEGDGTVPGTLSARFDRKS